MTRVAITVAEIQMTQAGDKAVVLFVLKRGSNPTYEDKANGVAKLAKDGSEWCFTDMRPLDVSDQ